MAIPLLTPREAAESLGISDRQLRDLTDDGKIPFINVGRGATRPARRYETADVEAFKTLRSDLGTAATTHLDAMRHEFLRGVAVEGVSVVQSFFSRPAEGQVYLIRCAGRVKIGFTADFKERARVLRTACPFPIEVVAVVSGDRTLELLLHRTFRALRRHGEWFEEAGALLTLTKALSSVSLSVVTS